MNPAMCEEMTGLLEALEVNQRCGAVPSSAARVNRSPPAWNLKELFRDNESLNPEAWEQLSRRTRASPGTGLLRFTEADDRDGQRVVLRRGLQRRGLLRELRYRRGRGDLRRDVGSTGEHSAGTALKAASTVMRPRNVLYYALTGETFTGVEAARTGLVNRSVPLAGLRTKRAGWRSR